MLAMEWQSTYSLSLLKWDILGMRGVDLVMINEKRSKSTTVLMEVPQGSTFGHWCT